MLYLSISLVRIAAEKICHDSIILRPASSQSGIRSRHEVLAGVIADRRGGRLRSTPFSPLTIYPGKGIPHRSSSPSHNRSKKTTEAGICSASWFDITAENQSVVLKDAAYLTAHPAIKVVIGGYCDERGSTEYNLALGETAPAQSRRLP